MVFDYISVLIAVGAAGTALCITLVMSWLSQRRAGFLVSWAISIAIVVAAIASFAAFDAGAPALWVIVGCVLLTTGFVASYGGLVQFRDGPFPRDTVAMMAAGAALPMIVAFAFGYTGAVVWLVNLISAGVLGFIGVQYWRMRAEAIAALTVIAFLHFVLAVSFFLCFVVGVIEFPLHLTGGMPDNWAEELNLVCAIIAITGIGGLLATVHQERTVGHHRVEALTDPLTGVNNRRALFEHFANETVPPGTAIIVFDLDDFKALNDRYGHAFGDTVLAGFAKILRLNVRPGDIAVRLGGEEFALVVAGVDETFALTIAERVRAAMAHTRPMAGDTGVRCTVSAGIAVAHKPGWSLDSLMRMADNALYLSKRNGRNRVTPLKSSAA